MTTDTKEAEARAIAALRGEVDALRTRLGEAERLLKLCEDHLSHLDDCPDRDKVTDTCPCGFRRLDERLTAFLAATPVVPTAKVFAVETFPPVTEETRSCGGCGGHSAAWQGWRRPDAGQCWWLWEPAFQMWTFLCRDEREDEATPALVTTPEKPRCRGVYYVNLAGSNHRCDCQREEGHGGICGSGQAAAGPLVAPTPEPACPCPNPGDQVECVGGTMCNCACHYPPTDPRYRGPAPAQPTVVRGPWPPRKGDRALSTGTRDVLTFNGDRNASGGYDVTDSKGRVVGGLGKQAIDGGMFQLIGPEVVPSAPATGEGAAPATTREETKRGGEPWLSLKCWSCFAGIGEPCANQPSICRGRIIAWASTPEAPRDGDGPCPLCGEPGEGYACDCSRGAAPQGPVEAAGPASVVALGWEDNLCSYCYMIGRHELTCRRAPGAIADLEDAHLQAHAEGRAEGLREAIMEVRAQERGDRSGGVAGENLRHGIELAARAIERLASAPPGTGETP